MSRIFRYSCVIVYQVNENHPDYELIDNPELLQTYTDIYELNEDYFPTYEDRKAYIENDLLLIAGGGDNIKGINIDNTIITILALGERDF